jgi:hypothetical protein
MLPLVFRARHDRAPRRMLEENGNLESWARDPRPVREKEMDEKRLNIDIVSDVV